MFTFGGYIEYLVGARIYSSWGYDRFRLIAATWFWSANDRCNRQRSLNSNQASSGFRVRS